MVEIKVEIEQFDKFLNALSESITEYENRKKNKEYYDLSLFEFIDNKFKKSSYFRKKGIEPLDSKFIEELTRAFGIMNINYWKKGCKLANQHINEWTEFIMFSTIISQKEAQKKYSDVLPPYDKRMSGLCGYIAQGKYVIEQLIGNKIDLSEIDESLGGSIKTQKKDLVELNEELSKKRKEEERLSHEIEKGVKEKSELDKKIEELRPKYEEISKCINNSDEIIGEKEKRKTELEEKIKELSGRYSQKGMEVQQLNIKIEGLENKKNELENKTNRLEDDVKELERNKEEIEASINELSKKEGKLKEIETSLNNEIANSDKRYIKNIKVMERLLHLSKTTSNRYQETVDALQRGYRREAINENIMMSMFWATCIDEIYKAMTDEEIKRAEEEMNSLNYEEIVECLVTVGEIIKDNLPRCDMLAINAHDLNDEEEVREISKSQAKEILDLYRKEDERGLNNKLEEIMTELNRLKIGNPYIRDMFVTPIINKLNSENSKLAMAMIVDSLKEYIKKYESHY